MIHTAPAARDFSALFGNGSIQAVLHVAWADENAADILTKPAFVTDASTATYSTCRKGAGFDMGWDIVCLVLGLKITQNCS